jgi:hypothetical protein
LEDGGVIGDTAPGGRDFRGDEDYGAVVGGH